MRPDGTGSVQLEHGIDEPERVTLRLTGEERDRLARLVGAVDLGAIEEDDPNRSRTRTAIRCASASEEAGWQSEGHAAGARGALARAGGAGAEVRASARVALVELAQHRLQLPHAPRDLVARCSRPSGPCGRGSGSRTAKKSQQLPPFGLRTFARSARRIAAARLRPSRLESLKLVRAILPRDVAVDLHRLFDAGDTSGLRVLDRTAQHRRGGADGSDGEPHQG